MSVQLGASTQKTAPKSKELTQDQMNRLDRQRFIGLETQKRMLNSLVLISPLNGPNSEFAKNLVLSGVNIAVYDPHIINERDFQTNFLVSHDSIGKNRGQTLLKKLSEMNQSAQHQLITQDITKKDAKYFSSFTLISTSTTSFAQMKKWDNICREINRPYFNLVASGLTCFSYISLGTKYNFTTKKASSATIVFGSDGKPKNPFIQYQQVNLNSLTFDQCFEGKSIKKQIYYSILMMKQAEQKGLKLDPFNIDEAVLAQIIQPIKKQRGEASLKFHTKFARTFGIEFCPVYSVLGSVLSQQFIKIVAQKDLPAVNWFYYDSQASIGQIIQLPEQNNSRETRINRPDLDEPVAAKKST